MKAHNLLLPEQSRQQQAKKEYKLKFLNRLFGISRLTVVFAVAGLAATAVMGLTITSGSYVDSLTAGLLLNSNSQLALAVMHHNKVSAQEPQMPITAGQVLGESTDNPTLAGLDLAGLTGLIDSQIGQYLTQANLAGQGQLSSSGSVTQSNNGNGQTTSVINSAPIISYYPSNASSNFTGASVLGITQLSGQNISANTANLVQTTTNNLTVSGPAVLGTTTVSSLVLSGPITSSSPGSPLTVTNGLTTGSILPLTPGSLSSNIITTVVVSGSAGGGVGNTDSMALGSDGFGRLAYIDNSNDYLHFVQCLDANCSTSYDTVVDSGESVLNLSMAIAPDGFARISYTNENTGDLVFAECSNASCSSVATTTVDTAAGDSFINSSLVLASDGTARITYDDSNTGDLVFAECSNASCSSVATTTVDTNVMINSNLHSNSLVLASDGTARIVYTDSSGSIKFATCGTADCSSVSNISTIDNSGDQNINASIALAPDNTASIAYVDNSSNAIKYVECFDTECDSFSSPAELNSEGFFPSVAIGPDGYPRIAYTDDFNGYLKYIQCESSDCSSNNNVTVDLAVSANSQSLVIGSDGFVRIAYTDENTGNLKFARLENADGSPTVLGTSIGASTAPFGPVNTAQVNVGNNISFNASTPLLDANNQIINGDFSANPLGAEQAVNGDFSADPVDETELATNGAFNGNANSWDLGGGWSYNTNNVIHAGSTGPELVTDGNFNTNPSLSGWTLGAGWTYNSGTHEVDNDGSGNNLTLTGLGLVSGHTYTVSFDITNNAGGGGVGALYNGGGVFNYGNGSFSTYITADSSDSITFDPVSFIGSIDNVSVKEGTINPISQTITGSTSGDEYQVSANVGGTTGSVTADLGNGDYISLAAGSNINSFTLTSNPDNATLDFTPSADFDGTLGAISVKKVLSWGFGQGWTWDSINHQATHNGSGFYESALVQVGQLTTGQIYQAQFNVSGTTGTVQACFGISYDCQTFGAGSGTVTYAGIYNASGIDGKIVFNPSYDFNGSISNVSIKPSNSWVLGTGWSWDSVAKAAVHDASASSTAILYEPGNLIEQNTYQAQFNIGGTAGTVVAQFDSGSYETFNAGSGIATLTGQYVRGAGYLIDFIPSTNFNGSITNVTIQQVDSNSHLLSVAAPTANSANGSNLVVEAAPGTGGGTAGLLQLADPTTGYKGTMDLSQLTSDQAYTFPDESGTFILANGSGDVGIGTTSPQDTLDVNGDIVDSTSNDYQIGANENNTYFNVNGGNVGIGTTTPAYLLEVGSASVASGTVARFQNANGTCDINPTTNTLACSSDERLKKDINPLTDGFDQVMALQPVYFNWNAEASGTPEHPGFIAQQVQQVMPEVISTDPNTGLLSIGYSDLVPSLVGAMQKMQSEIVTLQGGISSASSATSSLLTVYSPSNFSGDSVGEAEILSGATSTRVSFMNSYEYQPVVVATPMMLYPGLTYGVTEVDAGGFTISAENSNLQPPTSDVEFSWHSFSSPQAKLFVSDGSSSDIVLAIPAPPPVPAVPVVPLADSPASPPPDAGSVLGTSTPDSIPTSTPDSSTSTPDTSSSTPPVITISTDPSSTPPDIVPAPDTATATTDPSSTSSSDSASSTP